MTIFEELLSFDRPYIPVTLKIGEHEVKCLARKPSSEEEDKLDALEGDKYGEAIIKATTPVEGEVCELRRVKNIYLTRSKVEVLGQLLGTRQSDIQKRALELADINAATVMEAKKNLDDEGAKAYDADLTEKLKGHWKTALEEIEAEYDDKDFGELCDLMSQINVNMTALAEAGRAKSAARLHFQVFTEDKERVFPDIEKIFSLSSDTIRDLGQTVQIALLRASVPNLPFVLPVEAEPDAQPSSPSDSAADSTDGGTPTRRPRKNSKPSTKQ
jgi:hypothetical protein